jgi:hypothetical protein
VKDGNSNIRNTKELQPLQKMRTGQRTVSPDKPADNPSTDNRPELSPDLAAIISAWPSIPDQIKAAVKAVLAPYLTKKGGSE